jgi:hypothetical protein
MLVHPSHLQFPTFRTRKEQLPVYDPLGSARRCEEGRNSIGAPRKLMMRSQAGLEANVAYDVSAFVLDHIGTLSVLKSRLGVFVD